NGFIHSALPDPFLHELINFLAMFPSTLDSRKTRVVSQVFAFERDKNLCPVGLCRCTNRYIPVLCLVHIEWRTSGIRIRHALGHLPGGEKFHYVGQQKEGPVLHGNIDPVALARHFALTERGENTNHRKQRSRGIADRCPTTYGGAISVPCDTGDTARGLDNRIIGAPCATRAALTKPRDRTEDKSGIPFPQHGVVQTHLL